MDAVSAIPFASLLQALVEAVLVSLVVVPAVRLRWLSVSGAVAAFAVGWVTLVAGGWRAAAVLLTFFVTSSALSRWRAQRKQRFEFLTARGSQRVAAQVLANGGIATVCIALYGLTGDAGWWLAFGGAYAAANADTWSTEIGALSPTPPRHILSGQPLRAGDSGGVTLWGFLASAMGGLLVAVVAQIVHPISLVQAASVAVGGFAGSLVDSLLGAALQAKYRCAICDETVEAAVHCEQPAQYVSGWQWLNNDAVNLLCTLVGATVGLIGAT